MSDPEPTMVLIVPAASPTATMISAWAAGMPGSSVLCPLDYHCGTPAARDGSADARGLLGHFGRQGRRRAAAGGQGDDEQEQAGDAQAGQGGGHRPGRVVTGAQ